MAVERTADAISGDPMFRKLYLAVREDTINGAKIPFILAFGKTFADVEPEVIADNVEHPQAVYHVYFPKEKGQVRRGLIIGGEE